MTNEADRIREEVRQFYAKKAEKQVGEGSCCEPQGCGCGSGESTRSEIPSDVTGFSLGCGDPITAAELQPGETVLDLGSGGGLDCFLAAQIVGPQGFVIGTDMTEGMIERAKQSAASLGFDNVDFRRGLIEDIPADDQSVDVVISNCVINLSPDKPAVLRDAFRVLRPGGRFVVADIVTPGEMLAQYREQTDSWASCVAGAPPIDIYREQLAQAGFMDIDLQSVDGIPLDMIAPGTPFSALVRAHKPS
ncbi:MAG: arsenite methyltransferase [Anaerolineales bacterium]|jgi:SAM-dependent methyltransferase